MIVLRVNFHASFCALSPSLVRSFVAAALMLCTYFAWISVTLDNAHIVSIARLP